MTQGKETAVQLFRCGELRRGIGTSRRALRRECAIQQVSLRRTRSHLEAIEHGATTKHWLNS